MNRSQRALALKIAKALLPAENYERVTDIPFGDEGYGYDVFGLEKESAVLTYAIARYVYLHWFRVESAGHENVPLEGRALISPNHSGVIPIDGAMIGIDLVEKLPTPRVMRAMVDNFMGFLPFLNVFFYRVGQVVGARRNFEDLLKAEEIVCVFPEGTKGIGKPYSQKYRLVRFNVGFVELAVRFRVPIVPTAVVGAEEQAPMLYNIKPIARALNFPYFPVTPLFPHFGILGAIPLPVKYTIRYGEPFRFYESYPPEATDDPELMQGLAEKVQLRVQEMIDDMLAGRESVFGFGDGPRREPRPRRRQRRME